MVSDADRGRFLREGVVPLALAALTLLVFARVCAFEFVNYDDDTYIFENARVLQGLTWKNVVWAFSKPHTGLWHPLVLVSYMADISLFGPNPHAFHGVNLALQLVNTLLVYAVLRGLTGATWRSAVVAALFAIHPLHVEPVAWISSRKDMLYTAFWWVALWGYLRYTRKPGVGRYLPVAAGFVLALACKPMAVTLPVVLLVLDWWPLGGTKGLTQRAPRAAGSVPFLARVRVLEKLPLFLIALLAAVMAMQGGREQGNIAGYPVAIRAGNALVSYVTYLGRAVWPLDLAVHYPHPGFALPLWKPVAAGVFLVVVSAGVVLLRRRAPYLLAGWLWYLVTLLPAIGLVQVGDHASADRYTYVPLVGVFIMAVWGVPGAFAAWGGGLTAARRKAVLGAAAGLWIAVLSAVAWVQVGTWRNDITLFSHAVRVTAGNARMHNALGYALVQRDRSNLALDQYAEALRIDPDYAGAHFNYAAALAALGRVDDAIRHYREVIRIDPRHAHAHNNLGLLYAEQGDVAAARRCFEEALKIDPAHPQARGNLEGVR